MHAPPCSSGTHLAVTELSLVRRGSEAVAVAVWIRVLLPQILGPAGAVAVASPAAAAPGKAAAAAASASPPEPPPLSLAAATRAFKYLDGLLGTPAVKRDMHAGVAARDGEPPAPLVPPASLIALQQAVHGADGLQGEVAVLARSHEVRKLLLAADRFFQRGCHGRSDTAGTPYPVLQQHCVADLMPLIAAELVCTKWAEYI